MFLNCSFLTATVPEELALLYGDVPEHLIGFLNKVYTGALGAGANDMQTPVTTALLLLLSGAARGKPLGPFVRSIDTNPWPDDKKLNRVIKETLAKAKDRAEVKRFERSESPGDVAACMRRELKDPYVFMPKLPQGGNKKKARVAAEDAPDRAIASSSGASIGGVREGGDVGLLVSPRATWPRVPGGGVGESKDPDDFDFDESDFDEDEVILLLSSEVPDAPEGRGVGLDEGGGVGLGTALGMGIGEGGDVVLARGFEDRHAPPHAGGACEAEDVGASGRGPMKVSKVMPKVVELALYTHSDGTKEVVKVLAAYVEGSSEGFVGGSGGSSRTDDHGLTDHHACAQADSALRPRSPVTITPGRLGAEEGAR